MITISIHQQNHNWFHQSFNRLLEVQSPYFTDLPTYSFYLKLGWNAKKVVMYEEVRKELKKTGHTTYLFRESVETQINPQIYQTPNNS